MIAAPQVSVAEYFKTAYHELRYPHLPCLHVGNPKKHVYLPLEVCKLPGQKRMQRMTDQMTADMCAKTCTRPVDRQRRITERAKHNNYDTDPFLKVRAP